MFSSFRHNFCFRVRPFPFQLPRPHSVTATAVLPLPLRVASSNCSRLTGGILDHPWSITVSPWLCPEGSRAETWATNHSAGGNAALGPSRVAMVVGSRGAFCGCFPAPHPKPGGKRWHRRIASVSPSLGSTT